MAVFRVRYALAAKLVNELVEAADEKQLTKTAPATGASISFASTSLATSNSTAAEPRCCSRFWLFQVLTEREEKNSVAIASNGSYGGWTKTFTGDRLCAAIVDRLAFNGTIIETGTESYRLARTKAGQQQTKK
ncbi:ATP-binding protein [Streptomyces cellulosae]|uniref:ATP-binding protein n=1 Tax=Streptomyces cellulosae TaxID=1968 RepID=A0ABW7YJS9_STRCE